MEGRGLRGHLRLVCESDAAGRSVLTAQSFAAPVHIGKSFQEAGCCLLNVVNPTAGMLAGDRVDWDVTVGTGARLLLTTPSASRAHTMERGRAEFRQHFRVAEHGWLEVHPELFIPQREAAYRQVTQIEIAAGGGLLFLETLAPGRVASGESFAFRQLDWDTRIESAGRLILRERYTLGPDESAAPLRTLWPETYYGSAVFVHPGARAESLLPALADLDPQDAVAGVSDLHSSRVIVKVLAASSPALRRVLQEVRQSVYRLTGHEVPSLRRT